MAPPVAETTIVATIAGFTATSTVTNSLPTTSTTNKSRRKSSIALGGISSKGAGLTGINGTACSVNEDTLKLIECVKSRPALWHRKHLRQRVQVAHHGWEEIRKSFKATEVSSLKVRWKTLRDSFRREVKRIEDGEIVNSSWPLFDRMSFLIGHFRTRESYYKNEPISSDLNRNSCSSQNSNDGACHKMGSQPEEPASSSMITTTAALAQPGDHEHNNIEVVEAITIYPNIRNGTFETLPESAAVGPEQHIVETDPDEVTMVETYESLQQEDTIVEEEEDDVILEPVSAHDEVIEVPSGVFGEVTFKNKLRARIKTEPIDGEQRDSKPFVGPGGMLETDSDWNFLMSLHPFMKRLPSKKNLSIRIKIQQLIAEVMEDDE
ncbi:uncharacterized protein LOC129748520 [Uranotaenia lowii]|uniref:uncharacterized protein LOC129748520 n=1 Tax=Uranotaenia lowii TaxID=190385 RepID=UPI0024798E55|nr:uncharacterized protein LOC129748520 [Uranotaenia lowii]